MLPPHRLVTTGVPAAFESVHNYYKELVTDELLRRFPHETDLDYIADLMCLALNQLPPRYVRHNVDMAFFMTSEERDEFDKNTVRAVDEAVKAFALRQARESSSSDDHHEDGELPSGNDERA